MDYPYPEKVTIRWMVGYLREYWHTILPSSLPQKERMLLLRQQVELLLYAWWQHRRGRPFRLPIEDGTMRPQRVTKQIPQIFLTVFGHRVYVLVGTTLESVPLEDGQSPEGTSQG